MASGSDADQQYHAKFEERFPKIWKGHVVIQERVAALEMRFLHGHKDTAEMALKDHKIIGSESIDHLTPMTQEEYFHTATENDERNSCYLLALPYGTTAVERRINHAQAFSFLHFIRSHHNYYAVSRSVSPTSADDASESQITLYSPATAEEEENNQFLEQSRYSVYLYIPNAFTDSVVKRFAPDWYHVLKKKLYFIAVILEKRPDVEVSDDDSYDPAYDEDTEEYEYTDDENVDPNPKKK